MITWKDVTDSEEFQSSSRPVQLEIYRRWIEDEVAKEFDNDPYILDHFRNQPMDTGQGVIATTANAAAQNVLGTIPTAIAGVGAMTGSQGMEEFGKGGMEYAAEAFPTNPANPNAAMFGNVIGNVGTMAFGGAGLAKSALALGATKMGALVAAKAGTLLVGGAMGGVEGAQAADQAGLTGFDRQLGAMIGGAKEIASETMLFGMGTETALARRMLGMAGKKSGGIIRSVFQEAGEEGVGQFGQNVGIRALADDDKQPGLFDDVASSTFWGGVGGGLFGGLNLTLLNGTILPPAAASDVRPVTSEAEIAEGEVPVFHQGKLVGAKPVIQQEEFEPIADLIEELPPAASAVVESTDIAAKSLDETAKIAPEAVAATSRVAEEIGLTDVAEVPVEEVVTEEAVVEPPVEQVEIPYAERPSPNLAPRADFQAPSRPEKRGEERDAWDEQFGMDRRGGRSHNDDGTPYQPTVHDETVAVALASLKGKSDEERIDAIGDQHETTVSNSIKRLLNAGWIWDANSGKMVNPQNPSERPIDFLVGKKQDQEVIDLTDEGAIVPPMETPTTATSQNINDLAQADPVAFAATQADAIAGLRQQGLYPTHVNATAALPTQDAVSASRNTDLFPDKTDFMGKLSQEAILSNYQERDGFGVAEYVNPDTGTTDVYLAAFGDNDFIAYIRVYDENGKPTNRFTSKLERRSKAPGVTKKMLSDLQSRLPAGHEYTEDVSVSTDGLKFIAGQLRQGYEVALDESGKPLTQDVAVSGESIVNDLPIAVDPNGKFENIRITNRAEFDKVRPVLGKMLESFGVGLGAQNVRWENGTAFIDIPVLRRKPAAPEVDISTDTETPEAWDRANRHQQSNEWFEGGRANLAVNEAFNRAATNGGADLATHGMAKVATLSGAIKALTDLLKNGLDQSRGRDADGARLHTAPLAVERDSAAVHAGTTSGGTSYRDGPFILVNSAAASRSDVGIRTMDTVQAVLVNEANAGQLDAIRKAIHAIRPDIIVELYSKADQVAATLTGKKGKVAEGVKKVIPGAETQQVSSKEAEPTTATEGTLTPGGVGTLPESIVSGIRSGVASKDMDMREMWAEQMARKLEKKGELTWHDIPKELADGMDTAEFAALKAAIAENPKEAISIVAGEYLSKTNEQDAQGQPGSKGTVAEGVKKVIPVVEKVVARDATKPEQMTPEEFVPVGNPVNQGIFKSKKEASVRLSELEETVSKSQQMLGILAEFNLVPSDAYEVAKDPAGRWSLGATHKHRIALAAREKQPVSKAAVDAYGITLPAGYVQDGELYVYRPSGTVGAVKGDAAIKAAKKQAQEIEKLKREGKIKPEDESYWSTPVEGQPKDPIPDVKDTNGIQINEGDVVEFSGVLGGKGTGKVRWVGPYIANASGELQPGFWSANGVLRANGAPLTIIERDGEPISPPTIETPTKPKEQQNPDEYLADFSYDIALARAERDNTGKSLKALKKEGRGAYEKRIREQLRQSHVDAIKIASGLDGDSNKDFAKYGMSAPHNPVSKAAVDAYGITLPEGYTRQGDLYVYAPTAPTNTPTETALPQASKEVGPQVSTEPRTETVRGKEAVGGELKRDVANKQDAEYLSAVEAGDANTAQRLVNDAALSNATKVTRHTEEKTDTPLDGTYRVDVDGILYRTVTQSDWDRIESQGFLDSDQRNAVSRNEGVNLANNALSSITYAIPGEDSVLLGIKPEGIGLHGYTDDSYIRTWDKIPYDSIIPLGKFIGQETKPSYLADITYDDAGNIIPPSQRFKESSPSPLSILRKSVAAELPEKAQNKWTPEVYAAAEKYFKSKNLRDLDSLTQPQRDRIQRALYDAFPEQAKAQKDADKAELQKIKEDRKAMDKDANPTPKELSFDPIKPSVYALTGNPAAPLTDEQLKQEIAARKQGKLPNRDIGVYVRLFAGNMVSKGVSMDEARAAMQNEAASIPGVNKDVWIGTSAEFDAEFPGKSPAGAAEAVITTIDGRSVVAIFTDRVEVREADVTNAANNQTTRGVEAVRRLLRHEVFGHRGFSALPVELRQRFFDMMDAGLVPESDLDAIVNAGYRSFADWRTNVASRHALHEEWLAGRMEGAERIPSTGLVARFMDWLSDVWRHITGSTRNEYPTLDELKDTMRAMHKALADLQNRDTSGNFQNPSDLANRYSYAGANAQLPQFMQDSLETAKAMAAAGKTSEEIRAITGWFPGKYDGKMRWEIPDDGAKLKDDFGKAKVVSDLIDHPALFDAYPSIAEVPVVFSGFTAGITKDGKTLILPLMTAKFGSDNAALLGGVLHEIQHLIQAIEGFARGGNTEGIYAAEKLAIEKKKAELESIRDAAKVAYEKRVTDANLAAWKAAVDDVWEVMGEKPARRTREEELDYYRRIAGEIESRDIEARKNLTPEQRKAIAPYSSENIAKEDAIVMFDSGATKYALGTAQDAEYLAAVEAGDSGSDNLIQLLRDAPESKRKAVVDAWLQRNPKAAANMQRMVDAAAKAAGYDREAFKAMPEKDWRTDEPINVINSTNGPWAGFFTDTKGVADRFGRIMRQPVRRAFLKLTKPFEVDASGKAAGELQFDILDDSGTHAQKNNAEILAAINSGSYDSIILKNTVDEGTVIVPLDPSQIKSADPITYDDAGNIIPLSQRFQETSPDIRYALGTGGSDTILSGTYPQPKLKVSDQKPPKIIADIEFDKIDKDNKYTGTALLYESVDFKDKFIPWAYDTMTPELAEWTAANANNKEAIYARMGIGNVRSDAPLAVFYAAASLKAPSFAAKAVLADAHKNLITDVAQTLAVQGVAQYSKELGAFYAEQSVMDLMRKYRDRVLNENLGKEGSAESVAPKIQEAAKVAGDVVNDAVESIDSEIELAVAATEDPEIKGWLTEIFNALVKKARLLKHLAFLRSKKAIGTGDEFGSFDADLSKLTEEETLKLIAEQDGIMVDRKKKTQNKMRERSAKAKPTDEQMASEGEKRARAIISRIKASSKGKTAKERSAEAKAVDAMYAKHLKSPMTEQEFLKGAEGILEEKTAKELYSQSLIEIANREIRATKKASGQGRADAIIARIKASANGKPVKERTEQAKAVDKLFSDHVSSPMSEDEFLKRAKGLMDEKTALELFKQAAAKRQRALDDEVDPDTLAKELMKADATRLKGTEKEGKIPKFDSIEKLYNLAKKQGDQDRTAFVKAMMDFGVSEENANALFGYAQMYRESQTPGRKSGGTVSSVFSSQVKSPEPYQAFKDKLKKFNVRPSVVDALFAAARNETTLRQKDAIEARKRDLVNLDTGDMMRLVSRLRSKLGNINWASVFNQSQAMQGTLQERIADAVEQELQNQSPQIKKIQDRIDALETGDPNIPELQKQIEDLRKTIKPLSEAERKAIGAAVADVFERAQKGYLDGVMKRIADSPRIKAEAAEKLKNALPKLIRAYNNGLLGREEYHNIMAQEFGLKEFSQATFDKAKKIVSDIQETNSPTVRRQKTFELAELVQKNADIPLAEILQSFWIISVLTGVRTHFAMFTAAWNGFRAVFQSAVDAAVFKRSPGAAIKSIRAFVKAFFRGIHEVMVYTFNAEPTMIDSFEQSQNVFLDGMQGSKLFSAAERLVMKGGKGKVFGSYMAFFERLMRAWDHITSTSTVAGIRETAAILNPEIYNAALKPSEADIKATEKFVADAHWNGTRPTGAVDKIIFDSQVRQNIDQIYIERLKAEKQALIDSGALAEAKNKQDDIQSYQRFIDDVRAVGSSAAYQEDPKGVGGFIYTRLKGFTGGLGVASKAKLEASMKEFQMNKAEMDLRDNVTERIKLGVLWTQYLAATMARPILGLQFVRFVGNRLNEIISFTPGLGLLRASFEEQFQGGKNAALKRLIVQNQVVGTALAIVGYYALKALKDEPDEEKRGWSISGSWGNLTPDRKSQLMSAGKSPFSLTIWMNGRPVNLSYNDWPIASILATVGSINDIRSYTPDRWAEKSDTDHLFSAIWAGSSSFMDMSALSGFMDSIGSSAYSTEPDTAFIQKLNKTAANFAGGFIPRFLKDIDFMISEEANRVSSSDLFGRWAKELPFYRRNVGEPMIDILGNQVKTPRTPWSRAIKLSPEDDAYKLLGALNSRGLWLGGVNAANRRIGYGNKRRELTADEALTFEVEAGKLYREILKRHGERLIKMPYAAAKDMISKLTETARDRAFNKVRQMAARG